jgi:hypothetical protein
VIRLLLFLLGTVTAGKAGNRDMAGYRGISPRGGLTTATAGVAAHPGSGVPVDGTTLPAEPGSPPPWPAGTAGGPGQDGPGGNWGGMGRRRRIPRWVKWATGLALVGLVFRRAIASVVLIALSATLHLLGFNIHLPSIKFAWPWQTIAAGTTTNTNLGPWVLQKIEGISRPALGQANFNFVFTHKVSKSIGPWPCWYASTFYAVGHASATVNLNPGPAWWAPSTGHYQLKVLSRPAGGKPGRVTVTMSLPQPQLPRSAHNVTIDNIPSKPLDTQHSWTYPGLGCGVLLKPQFPESVLYSQAQSIAFYKATHSPQITRPLIGTAEAQATQTIRNNFIQPTLNAFGYTLTSFAIDWVAQPGPRVPPAP